MCYISLRNFILFAVGSIPAPTTLIATWIFNDGPPWIFSDEPPWIVNNAPPWIFNDAPACAALPRPENPGRKPPTLLLTHFYIKGKFNSSALLVTDIFTKFCGVPFLVQIKWRFVVVISSFKRVFSKTNVCLRWTIVVGRNCSLIYNGFDQTLFGHWALLFLSTVTCAFFARCGGLWQFGLVVSVDGLFDIRHATVAYFNSVAVEYFV